MLVANGEDRVAFIGEKLTFKFPKAHPIRFGERVAQLVKRGGTRAVVGDFMRFDADVHQSLRNLLLHGIVANRREGRLAREFGKVVVPTVSMLGGVLNVQRTAQPTEVSHRDIHKSFAANLGSAVTKLGHMLEDTANLGISDDMVRFVDGGSEGLERLMESNPAEVEGSLEAIGSVAGL